MAPLGRGAWVAVALCAVVALSAPHRSQAQSDHRLVWRTVETPHFAIHYHEPLGVLARHFAAQAEAVNARISSALGLRLDQRVQLVIADEDDAANGSATPLPYNVIRLRTVAPDDMSPLGDYDDWPTLLLTHEHTHILHLEESSGLPSLIQAVLGRAYTPQQFLPDWFIEGLAVVEETAHTTGGRSRGSIFDMYMRMDALEGRLLGLDWIGFDGEPWPHGNVRYLYGQAFLEFVARRYGQRPLGVFAEEYGKRLVPYGINRAAKRATGKSFLELYQEFFDELKARSSAVLAGVEARGRIEGTRLTFHGETTRSPRFVSDGELVYHVFDERHPPEIRRVVLGAAPRSERITRVAGSSSLSKVPGVPGGERIVFSAGEYHRGTYFFNELHSVRLDGTERELLTRAVRAREPDVSPDGKRVAFVTHSAGTSHLEIAELRDVEHTRRVVVRSRRLEQVYTPRWSPDGKRIAYGGWSVGGYRDLWLLDVESGARTRITYDRAVDRGPVFAPDGKTLYFSSDRTGIANLYAYRLDTGELAQITNVIGGAFQPDVSPDGKQLVYVGYTSKGYDLFMLPLDGAAPLEALPARERAQANPPLEPLPVASTPYQPLYTLAPRSWQVASENNGRAQQLTLTLTGTDAVGFHSWGLTASQSLEDPERAFDVGYSYRKPRFPVNVRFALRDQIRSDLVTANRPREWDARSWSGSIGTSFSFPRPLRVLAFRTDYLASFLEKRAPFDLVIDPNDAPPTLPSTGYDARLTGSVTLATAQRQAYDISQSWGYVATVSPSYRNPVFGSQRTDVGLTWRYEQFFRFDVRETVLAFAYTGAYDTPVSLGGLPAQVGPIFDYITGSRGSPTDYARLRGFPRRGGQNLQVLQLELRSLVVRINRGIDTLPIFARRIHAAIFSDIGDAYDGRLKTSNLGVGIGGELRLDWAQGYGNNLMLRIGIAQGLTTGGELQWYTTMTKPF